MAFTGHSPRAAFLAMIPNRLILTPSRHFLEGNFWILSSLVDSLLVRLIWYDWPLIAVEGGFSGNVGLDAHLLFTYSAIQILTILDELNSNNINVDATVSCIRMNSS